MKNKTITGGRGYGKRAKQQKELNELPAGAFVKIIQRTQTVLWSPEAAKEIKENGIPNPSYFTWAGILPLLFFFLPIFAQSQDTICLPADRLGRIADTIAYLRQFERYAIISDSAIVECKSWVAALQGQNNSLTTQRDAAVKGGEILAIQIQEQKTVSDKWKQAASDMDIKLQKAKRRGRLFAALFGGAAGGGLLAGLIIGLTK